eukprot:690104-Prymnesium_polylepis.1
MLIESDAEQARVLVALMVSITFLALHLSIKPLVRVEDGALMTMIELALVLIYCCVLVVKSCHMAPSLCATYGLGDDSQGIYLFFIFFGLSVLLLQLMIGAVRLYLAGHVPTIILVAKAHSVPLSTIVARISARRVRVAKSRLARLFRLDTARLPPATAAAVI